VTAIDHAEVPRGVFSTGGLPPETVAPSVWSFNGKGVLHFVQVAAVGGFSA